MASGAPIAIVTGAGSGIGEAVARALAAEGFGLTLVGRRQEKLQAVADALGSEVDTQVVSADLAQPESATRVVDATVARWDRIDALVNNAGVAPLEPIDATTEDLIRDTFEINSFAPIRLVASAWPFFCRQRSGCVVNISTIGVVDPFPRFAVYAASKGAVEALTRSVMSEGRSLGIRAYTVAPGAVETALLRSNFSERQIPPSGTLAPADVADVVVDCIQGRREADLGRTIPLASP